MSIVLESELLALLPESPIYMKLMCIEKLTHAHKYKAFYL